MRQPPPSPYVGQPASLGAAYATIFQRYQQLCRTHIHRLEEVAGRATAGRALRRCDQVLKAPGLLEPGQRDQWLGFVQGVLASARILDMDQEATHVAQWLNAVSAAAAPPPGRRPDPPGL